MICLWRDRKNVDQYKFLLSKYIKKCSSSVWFFSFCIFSCQIITPLGWKLHKVTLNWKTWTISYLSQLKVPYRKWSYVFNKIPQSSSAASKYYVKEKYEIGVSHQCWKSNGAAQIRHQYSLLLLHFVLQLDPLIIVNEFKNWTPLLSIY